MILERAAERIAMSWGWRRRLAALLAGALGALALPPFDAFPALVVSLTGAVWLLDGTAADTRRGAARQAFATGWWFGFGFFLAGLWWLGAAFLVEADKFAWLMPLGVVALPAALALFHGLAFAAARLAWARGAARVLVLAVALCAADYLRGHVLTGFPWNVYGMTLGAHLWTAQAAAAIGVYGLGLLAVAIAASPATLADGGGRRRFAAPLLGAIALAGLAGYGAWRVPAGPSPTVAGVKLRIVQPNVPQDARFRYDQRDAIMRRYLAMSDRSTSPSTTGVSDVTHLVWPESAFPFLLAREPAALAQIAALLPPGVSLITGAARAVEPLPGETAFHYRNSIYAIGDDGTIRDTYDKTHLVPFGEYLPFSRWLDRLGLRQFVAVPGGFEPGERQRLLQVPGMPPAAALICYEAIFPGDVAARPAPGGAPPGLILNLTNDAWFGDTPGPRQHFAQARLRAVEEGLPLVRAANSGISAVVDPYGRVLASLPLAREGVLDSPLPVQIVLSRLSQSKDTFLAILVVLFISLALMAQRFASRTIL